MRRLLKSRTGSQISRGFAAVASLAAVWVAAGAPFDGGW